MNKTFKIFTFGCKTNIQESDFISQELKKIGFLEKEQEERTEFIIVNSCTVTSKADDEILYLIRKLRKQEPDAKIILTGCLAQVDEKRLSQNADIDLILGNSEKLKIVDYIFDSTNKVQDLLIKKDFDEFSLEKTKRTRATLKIQDGCNNFCSYCIIPFARGKSRSSHMENVLDNINQYVQNGYKEIVLSAIHLGLWGLDLNPKLTLLDLLKEIEKIEGLERYRLGSLDPSELTEDLLDFLVQSKKVCNHFHISLQSACDKTLKNMNRHYSVEDAIQKMNFLSANIPYLNMGADIIVGFPDETDEDFLITYNNISSMPLNYMHIFPYSIRQYTKAASMENQIDDKIKKERAKKLKELANIKQEKFLNSLIGSCQKVLVENTKKDTKIYKGVASNYVKFLIESDENICNNIVHAECLKIENKKIFAKFNN